MYQNNVLYILVNVYTSVLHVGQMVHCIWQSCSGDCICQRSSGVVLIVYTVYMCIVLIVYIHVYCIYSIYNLQCIVFIVYIHTCVYIVFIVLYTCVLYL